jgi:hypothetical protein
MIIPSPAAPRLWTRSGFACQDRGHSTNNRRTITRTLISFDIDGTLEIGDPPGIVTIAMVQLAKRLGYVIGSCSDRPIRFQQELWERLRIGVDFTVLKHRLADVKALFPVATTYYHIGDTETDHAVAVGAGFRFLRADASHHRAWGPELFAPEP